MVAVSQTDEDLTYGNNIRYGIVNTLNISPFSFIECNNVVAIQQG
jgi:hypothetical protein